MSSHSPQRRSLLRSFLLAPLALWLGRGQNIFAAGPDLAKTLVKETDPMPSALKYHEDAKKAPKDLRKSDDMHCKNCAQYTKKGAVKGKEVGVCVLLNGNVYADGWCMSWAKKS